MRIALITDTHAGARSESEAFNSYFFDFWEKTFFPYLEEHNIKQVIHLGDTVDRQKYINYVIANQWRTRFWDRLLANNIAVDVLVGNHDAPNNRYSNTPNAVEELWGNYHNVRVFSEPCVQIYDGCPIAMIPWINKGNYDQTMKFIDECKATVAMAHLELVGFEMDRGNVAKFGMDRELFRKFQTVCSGHYHHRSTDGHIFYLGNTYEITWADFDDTRGFTVFDTDNHSLLFVPNPHRMHYKLTYDNSVVDGTMYDEVKELAGKVVRVQVLVKDKNFDRFIQDMHDVGVYKIEIEDFTDADATSTAAEVTGVEDTNTTIDRYIDESDTKVSKDVLKQLMREVYKEAHDSL